MSVRRTMRQPNTSSRLHVEAIRDILSSHPKAIKIPLHRSNVSTILVLVRNGNSPYNPVPYQSNVLCCGHRLWQQASFRVFAEALGVGQDYFVYRACETLSARSLPSIREGSWASYILRRSASGCIFSCGPEGDEI
jgi:hypothetical protein